MKLLWVLLESQEVRRVWHLRMISLRRRWGPEMAIRRFTTRCQTPFFRWSSGQPRVQHLGREMRTKGQRRPPGNSCFCFKTQLTWLHPPPVCSATATLCLSVCPLRAEAVFSQPPSSHHTCLIPVNSWLCASGMRPADGWRRVGRRKKELRGRKEKRD